MTPPLKAWLETCRACAGRTKRCRVCNGKGYRVIDLSNRYRPDAVPQAKKPRQKGNTVRRRLADGLCQRCGDEPLESRTLGARCLKAMRQTI